MTTFRSWRNRGLWALACLASCNLCLSTAPALAAPGVWTSHGPEGGEILALAVDPRAAGTLYAGTYGGLSKTTDRGATWARKDHGLGIESLLGILGDGIVTVAVDRGRPRTVYTARLAERNRGAWQPNRTRSSTTAVRLRPRPDLVRPASSSVTLAALSRVLRDHGSEGASRGRNRARSTRVAKRSWPADQLKVRKKSPVPGGPLIVSRRGPSSGSATSSKVRNRQH